MSTRYGPNAPCTFDVHFGFQSFSVGIMKIPQHWHLLTLGLFGWLVVSCTRPSTSSEKETTADCPIGEVEPGNVTVRWAEGFGFDQDGAILWLAHAGDTTRWCHEGKGACPSGVVPLPPAAFLTLATWSTTHVPFVRSIGGQDQWVASGYLDRVAGEQEEKRKPLGGDAGVDEEMLLVSGADVLTSYPFGDPMLGVEDRTGVPVMAMAEYAEGHPLGRAEFIKVFGWLTGRTEAAEAAFSELEVAYLETKRMAELAAEEEGRPVVFAGSSKGGKWTAPGEDGLVASLLQDAGAAYAFQGAETDRMGIEKVGSNYEVETEQCALLAARCDAFGKVVYAPDGWTVDQARVEAPWFDFDGRLAFHCNTAEVDYFGQAIMEPHVMLADLVALFHPSTGDRSGVYFKSTAP